MIARTTFFCLLLLSLAAATVSAQSCPGDCDGDGEITVAELIRGVRIALGQSSLDDCPSFDVDGDGRVVVGELIQAVRAALESCAPAGAVCGDGVALFPEECDDGNVSSGDGCDAECRLELGGDVCAGITSTDTTEYRGVLAADGLDNPIGIAGPPLDPYRMVVLEQRGMLRLLRRTADGFEVAEEPFLDLTAQVIFSSGNDERGLLGIAFHPNYEENGWFFLNYSCRRGGCPGDATQGTSVISRFNRDPESPDRADPSSERILLVVPQRFPNHNGGHLAFGPDGMLYIGMGDGGFREDPDETGQRDDTILGKMLRVDVDVPDSPFWRVPPDNPNPVEGELGLIWAKGLRNPWRYSFDRANGDLYIADVGQDTFEEVSVQPGDSQGGENYGWDIFEADFCHEPDPAPMCPMGAAADEFVFPVHQYGRGEGVSITGGFVYRGCVLDSLNGTYLFSDFIFSGIRSFVLVDGEATEVGEITDAIEVDDGRQIQAVSSYGEDARGEIYILDRTGEIFFLAPR